MAYCPSCRQVVSRNDDFCRRCGRSLAGGGADRGYSSQRPIDDDSKVKNRVRCVREGNIT